MRYLLFLLCGGGAASLYWIHFTGHDNESEGALAAAILLTVIGLAGAAMLAWFEEKL